MMGQEGDVGSLRGEGLRGLTPPPSEKNNDLV